jgi:hypothetical protein
MIITVIPELAFIYYPTLALVGDIRDPDSADPNTFRFQAVVYVFPQRLV